jgi:hypothetical protein
MTKKHLMYDMHVEYVMHGDEVVQPLPGLQESPMSVKHIVRQCA